MIVTHVGGPTALVEIDGWRLLTDPTFDPAGTHYRFGWGTTSHKTTDPALALEDLPEIHAVLLSHDEHEDNLDIAGRALLERVGTVVTTPPGARRLGRTEARGAGQRGAVGAPGTGTSRPPARGAAGTPDTGDRRTAARDGAGTPGTGTGRPAARDGAGTPGTATRRPAHAGHPDVRGLATGQRTELRAAGRPTLTVEATPARHGPPLTRPLVGATSGFAVRREGSEQVLLWVTGDTVAHRALDRFADGADVDVMLVHGGGAQFRSTGPMRYTMTAPQAIDLIARTRPRVAVPIHDEGWSHFHSDRTAFETALASAPADVRARVRILALGAPTALT